VDPDGVHSRGLKVWLLPFPRLAGPFFFFLRCLPAREFSPRPGSALSQTPFVWMFDLCIPFRGPGWLGLGDSRPGYHPRPPGQSNAPAPLRLNSLFLRVFLRRLMRPHRFRSLHSFNIPPLSFYDCPFRQTVLTCLPPPFFLGKRRRVCSSPPPLSPLLNHQVN